MSFEKYNRCYLDASGTVLRPGKEKKLFPLFFDYDKSKRYRLFVTGETGLFYQWRNEPDYPSLYRSIEDSLSADEAELSTFALSLTSRAPEKYVRRAYKKILFPPRLSYLDLLPIPKSFILGARVKARGLKIEDGGFLRIRAAIRYLHDGVSRHSNENEPDEVHILDIPEGDYGYRELSEVISLDGENVASVGIFVEGKLYSGEVYIEEPRFEGGGYNLLPGFAKSIQGKDGFEWTGQYLSRKEWPEFRVTIGDTVVFEGEIFERCHRDSEWEIDLPTELLESCREIGIQLISDYHDPLTYTVHELGIIESENGEFSVVSVPETVTAGGRANILVRTANDGVKLTAHYLEHAFGEREFLLEKAGLHTLSFDIDETPSESITVLLDSGKEQKTCTIEHSVIRSDDGVYTGTGDHIYIHQDRKSLEDYLCWYASEHIGNLLTIRPSYRWGGSRTVDGSDYKYISSLINGLSMKYSHMLDGRELEGLNANPDTEMLSGEGFLGRQMHERDGAMLYWQRYTRPSALTSEQFDDMCIETCREDPYHSNPIYDGQSLVYCVPKRTRKKFGATVPTFEGDTVDGEQTFLHKDQTIPKDMKAGHDYTVKRLRETRFPDVTRHTGPSVAFKYFFEAGYSWVGAETMYGTLEELMAFLRGATRAAGSRDLGVHHALQWSSSPHDAPEHVRRYRLALFVSYMQGATEINTEEGLWRLEEYYSRFHRFTDTCKAHAQMQKDFYRYISSHTRRGRFYTPMALIHGRCDGYNGFSRNMPWGYFRTPDTDAERSWDLLRTFYPEGTLGDPIYFHNCPTDKPLGFNSSTPVGNVDVIPIESNGELIREYRAAAFMGYNLADGRDMQMLIDYVKAGGRLMLTLAHLTKTTDYESIARGELEYIDTPLSFTSGTPIFETKTVSGREIPVCTNMQTPKRVIARADDGTPIASVYTLEDGEVTIFAVGAYPAHTAISELYSKELNTLMKDAYEEEYVSVSSSDKVSTAIYKRDDGSYDVYMTAVDWYREPEASRCALFRMGSSYHKIHMSFGSMIKCCVKDGFAVYPHSDAAEVISIGEDGTVTVQGTKTVVFTVFEKDTERDITVDFKGGNLQTLKIR